MQQITLNDEDVEWIRPNDNGWDDLKDCIFHADAFAAFTREVGIPEALEQVTRFHRHVANQLIRTATKDPTTSPWAARTIALCNRLRSRRRWLRGAYIRLHGQDALEDVLVRFDMEYPRAEWGVDA